MHLNGWIGLNKARERHVFNLAGDKPTLRLESREQKSYSPPCGGPRKLAFGTTPEKIDRTYLGIAKSTNPDRRRDSCPYRACNLGAILN